MGKWKKRCEDAERRCEIAERQLAQNVDFFEKAEKRVDAETKQISWVLPHPTSAFNEVWTRDKENARWLMKYEAVS